MGKFASDITHGKLVNYVVLQARTDSLEKAHKFYWQIGFEECGFYDHDTELSKHVFKDFPDVLKLAEHSNRDFIHFIRDLEKNPDLAIFKNTTGHFVKERGRQRRLTERFRDVKFLTEPESISFPFSSKREHLMLLASGLDFYFLPFQNDEDINEFLQPNNMYSQHSIVTVQRWDRECLINKWLGPRYSNSSLAPSNPGWELTDPTIDFFPGGMLLVPKLQISDMLLYMLIQLTISAFSMLPIALLGLLWMGQQRLLSTSVFYQFLMFSDCHTMLQQR